jgi:hypothetical protein
LDRPQCCGKIATICALQFALLRGRLHKNCWNPTFCWWNLHFGQLSVSERGLVYTHEIAIYE